MHWCCSVFCLRGSTELYENKWLLLDHEEVFCLISSTLCSFVYYVVWRELSRCAGLRKLVVLCMHLRPFIIMSKLLWIFHGLSVLIVLWFLFLRKYSLLLYLNVVEIVRILSFSGNIPSLSKWLLHKCHKWWHALRLLASPCWLWNAYKQALYLREKCERERECVQESGEKERAAMAAAKELSHPSPCIYYIISLSLNNMDSLPWM